MSCADTGWGERKREPGRKEKSLDDGMGKTLALPLSERLLLFQALRERHGTPRQCWETGGGHRHSPGGMRGEAPRAPRRPGLRQRLAPLSHRGRPCLPALLPRSSLPSSEPWAGAPDAVCTEQGGRRAGWVGAAVPACPAQHPCRCRRRSPWEPAPSRSCNPPACTCRRAGRSARLRSRKARFGRGRTTSRASGWSPPSSCSGSPAWCLPCGPATPGTGRAPRCTARSSAWWPGAWGRTPAGTGTGTGTGTGCAAPRQRFTDGRQRAPPAPRGRLLLNPSRHPRRPPLSACACVCVCLRVRVRVCVCPCPSAPPRRRPAGGERAMAASCPPGNSAVTWRDQP